MSPEDTVTTADLDFEEPELTEEYARFVTWANVVWNVRRWAEKQYGDDKVAAAMAIHLRKSLPQRKRRALDPIAERLLRVAWQTELAARIPEGFDEPTLRRVAALTLPVQAYYAMFNGLRALSYVRGSPIESHHSMHKEFAENRVADLPIPWGATVVGDPNDIDTCAVSPTGLITPYGFNPMERNHKAEAYIWAALRMTRRWKFSRERKEWLKYNKKKDGSPYKKLPPGQRAKIIESLRRTTLFDFVYELRCKAHYETAEEFAEEYGQDVVDRFHYGMTFVADSGLLMAEAQIAAYVGVDALKDAATAWSKKPRKLGEWATAALDRRVEAIEAYGPS